MTEVLTAMSLDALTDRYTNLHRDVYGYPFRGNLMQMSQAKAREFLIAQINRLQNQLEGEMA